MDTKVYFKVEMIMMDSDKGKLWSRMGQERRELLVEYHTAGEGLQDIVEVIEEELKVIDG